MNNNTAWCIYIIECQILMTKNKLCNKQPYLQVGTLDDLGFYIKNLTPGLTQVCKAVKNRAEELLYKPYAVSAGQY